MMTENQPTNSILVFDEYALESPIGKVYVWLSYDGILQFIGWHEARESTLDQLQNYYQVKEITLTSKTQSHAVIDTLNSYFSGRIHGIKSLGVAQFGTPFQQKVWQALRTIPAGMTMNYGELAAQVGNPKACRAVGMANNRNPISIVVPCHRVIGKNKTLVGYGGGLERKQWLLEHEDYYVKHNL